MAAEELEDIVLPTDDELAKQSGYIVYDPVSFPTMESGVRYLHPYAANRWDNVPQVLLTFNPGDTVRCLYSRHGNETAGRLYIVANPTPGLSIGWFDIQRDDNGRPNIYWIVDFELVRRAGSMTDIEPEVFRIGDIVRVFRLVSLSSLLPPIECVVIGITTSAIEGIEYLNLQWRRPDTTTESCYFPSRNCTLVRRNMSP